MKKQISIITVNFNGGKKTIDCLKSINQWPVISCQLSVIVVDNNSTDKSVEFINQLTSSRVNSLINNSLINNKSINNPLINNKLNIKLIKNKKNLGFARGVNKGIKYALKNGADYVMLLNQDAIVNGILPLRQAQVQNDRGTIDELVKVMKKDKKIGVCGPLIFTPDKKVWSAGGVIDKKRYSGGHLFKMLKKSPYQVDFISGCAMMIKKEVFEKIGFFDERFFLYYEDVDFCLRTKKAGFKVVFIPQAVVYHQISNGEKAKLKQYYMAKNRFVFFKKHASLKIKIREIIRLPRTIYEHLTRGETDALLGIKDYFLRRDQMKPLSFQT